MLCWLSTTCVGGSIEIVNVWSLASTIPLIDIKKNVRTEHNSEIAFSTFTHPPSWNAV
jgi:hypothetical protein